MEKQFEVNRYMVMKFEPDVDSLVQYSHSLDLDDCRSFIKRMRESFPSWEFSIVAVLDE